MAEKLTHHDAIQLYSGALMIRKGRLVHIREITQGVDGELRARVFDLKTQRLIPVKFDHIEFKTPAKRIGYINMDGNACYVTRLPVRVYTVGLHSSNLDVRVPQEAAYNHQMYDWKDKLRRLEDPAIIDAYENIYPTLLEAIEQAKANVSCCAFDKQFAVSSEGWIYYKHNKVGEILDMKPKFHPEYQYLETLLDGRHEKTSGTFGATSL
jgi:hypothetical protein